MNIRSTGFFITFEGIDGSGKSTQLERCADFLQHQGLTVLVTRNPGGTELGLDIRQMLLHYPGHVAPTCELLLYLADRAQHMETVILPALAAGTIILCDRHIDSTVAYQGYGRGLPLEEIETLNGIAARHRKPDLTLLFDGDPEILAHRVSKRGKADRLEREALAFHEKVRQGYLEIAKADPERVKVLDALKPIPVLEQEVRSILQKNIFHNWLSENQRPSEKFSYEAREAQNRSL